MTTSANENRPAAPVAVSSRGGCWHSIAVFSEWCLRREAPRWRPSLQRMAVLLPAVLAWLSAAVVWPDLRPVGAGAEAIRQLLYLAAVALFSAGQQFASKAVCWEVSTEMRDLVRLTGIGAKTLLWATTLSRWWTIGWMLLLMLPLAMFARTMGGVTQNQLLSGLYGLALLAALTGGFGMLAGVLTVDAKNPEKTASTATWLFLVIYNVGFVLIGQVVYWGNVLITGNESSALRDWSRQIAYCAPITSLTYALRSPALFSVSDTGYWMHYLTSTACAVLATLVIEIRFRSSPAGTVEADHSESLPSIAASKSTAAEQFSARDVAAERDDESTDHVRPGVYGRRSRCSDRPFFWKDVYILSDERKWLNMWSMFYVVAAMGMVFIAAVSTDHADRYRVMVAALPSLAVIAIVFSVRFDALLTAEFRDRTWGSLMLLPVDPVDLLRTKLLATFWEQRFAVLPFGVAQTALLLVGPKEGIVAGGMTMIIAIIVCGLLCQMSCINQLLGKLWWMGLCQAVGFIAAIVAAFSIWLNCGLWPGFVLTTAFLASIVLVVQFGCVNPLARNWVEP